MRQVFPGIMEAAEALKPRLQREHPGRKKPRLQRRYLLASGHAHTRQGVAQLWGVPRQTLGPGLALVATGGREALLALYGPAGKPRSRSPAVRAAMAQARQRPAGLAADDARRQGVQQTHHLDVHDHTLDSLVRPTLKAQRKVPRPRHPQKP